MKIAEFLLARIAEDEKLLKVTEDRGHSTHLADPVGMYSVTCPTCRQMVYGARERGLAECEAKRQAVKSYLGLWEAAKQLARAGQEDQANVARNMYAGVEIALGALALAYADHPDYDPSWSETD